MRVFGKWLGRVLLVGVLAGLALWLIGPYEDADLKAEFDASKLDGGVSAYFAQTEARFDDITPGVQKQVIWVGAAETKTPWSVLYIHGFSATAQEIRPVPDEVARALGANLVFTRLKGHGRGGDAMADPSVKDWMLDTAEGLAAARAVGDRVLVLSTSTGGTLAAAASVDESLMQDVAGMVMVSPNFAVNNPAAPLLTWPAARYWLPLLMGERRSFEPRNEDQATYWTTEYPSVAGLPMAALVKAVDQLDLGKTDIPALFIFSDEDRVVRSDVTRTMIAEWGGKSEIWNPTLGPDDDDFAHVIAGDILSPSQTAPTVEKIVTWAKGL